MMDNKCNETKCEEPCKRKKEQEKEFKQVVKAGMDQYDVALRNLADR